MDLYTLKRFLGHTSLKSTIIYLHLIPERLQQCKSPLDRGGTYFYYRCVKKQNYRNVKCPVGYTKAEEIEKYVFEKLMEISDQDDILK